MPNTLCHIAIQGSLCRTALSPASFAWILLGCILPDLPWILMHLAQPLELWNPYDLRLYCTAQASLIFCALLAGAIAMFIRQSTTVFLIILVNCTLHLLLDSLQIKWGNGVNLLAPFDWHLFSAAWLWPDTPITKALTYLGLFYLFATWRQASAAVQRAYKLRFPKKWKTITATALFSAWLLGPFLFFPAMERADTYFLHTMRQKQERPGKTIAFDRAHFNAEKKEIRIYSGEYLHITGPQPLESGRVSFKGVFLSADTVQSTTFHVHQSFRDIASGVGLILSCTFLAHSLLLPLIYKNKP